jgi:predicted nuclease of predicted toxin-antitoxin system
MTRLLLDQGLAPQAAEMLRKRGFDAAHVFEVGMDTAEDSEIMD